MLSKRARAILVIGSLCVVLLVVLGGLIDDKNDIYKKLHIFVEVMNHIRSDYVEPVQTTTVIDGALKGMVRSLDSESSYLTPEEYKEYKEQLPARTASTGIEVVKHPANDYAMVIYIRPDSPAAESGLLVGDLIRAIDGNSTRELTLMSIRFLLDGPPGSTAQLNVTRADERGLLTFAIPRVELPDPVVTASTIDGVGYLKIPSFALALGTLETVREKCDEFAGSGIQALIVDLRGNVGGEYEEAVHVADLFIGDGKLLSVKSRSSEVNYEADEFAYDFAVYLLCDETTARSAEIFAVALEDRREATSVGRRTIGIGTIQRRIEMDDGALLNISYAKAIGAAGTDFHGQGIEPDLEVPKDSEDGENDVILRTAVERAKQDVNARQQVAASSAAY